jgi:hypothetical protein
MPLDETAEEAAELSRAEREITTIVDGEMEDNVTDEKSSARESHYRRLLSISGTRFIARTRNLCIYKGNFHKLKRHCLKWVFQQLQNL